MIATLIVWITSNDVCFRIIYLNKIIPYKTCKIFDIFLKTKTHKKKSVNKITLDFTKNVIIIEGDEGAEAVLSKVTYPVGTNLIPVEEFEDWEVLVEDSFKICKNTTIVGNPPVEGECLDELLNWR